MTRLLLSATNVASNVITGAKRKRINEDIVTAIDDNNLKLTAAFQSKMYRSETEIDAAFTTPGWLFCALSSEKTQFQENSRLLRAVVENSLEMAPQMKLSPTVVRVLEQNYTVTVKEKENTFQKFDSFTFNNGGGDGDDDNGNSLRKKDSRQITELLCEYFKFDCAAAIANIRKSSRYNNDPSYEYYQLADEQIKLKFHFSKQRGVLFHRWIEYKLLQRANGNETVSVSALDNNFERFYDEIIVRTLGLQLYQTEWQITDETHGITGRIDAAFIRNDIDSPSSIAALSQLLSTDETAAAAEKRREIYLFDWKCSSSSLLSMSEENEQNRKLSTLPAPLQSLANHVTNKYALQLALYRFILRRQGYDVRAMFVCRFDPTAQHGYEISRVDETGLDELVSYILSK